MSIISKFQPIIIIAVAILGIFIGQFASFVNLPTVLIEIFLMLLLFVLFLTVDLKQIKKAFTNVKYTAVALFINFVITPIIAFLLGKVFFSDSLEIRIGLLMLLVTPCTDWYLVFTGLAKGNVELNMSILPINLILQILLMPVYLLAFLSGEVQIGAFGLLQSVAFVLLVPFALAIITNKFIKNKANIKEWIADKSDNLQLLFLCLAVLVMFASEGKNLFENPILIVKLFISLILFFLLIFFVARLIGKAMKFEKRDIVALNFTTLARNSPLSLAIAVSAFPDYPLASLALVIGPLIELPVLAIIANILRKCNEK